MTTATTSPAPLAPAATASGQLDLQALEKAVATSKGFALFIIFGLPLIGVVSAAALTMNPLAALGAGVFLFYTSCICHRAVMTFTGRTLRILVAARLVLVMAVAALLGLTTGTVWATVVSSILLWLVADRLMGRRALYDLWKLAKKGS